MSTNIINGKLFAEQLQNQIQSTLDKENPPTLAVILVGNDPASEIYVRNKKAACQTVGINLLSYALKEETTQAELLELIQTLNLNPEVNGILVQLPLPKQINEADILKSISYLKDVDGFHPINIGLLAQQNPLLRPCTPYAVMTLLKAINFKFEGAQAVVVGASNIVGRPMALELLLENATVTVCNRFTKKLQDHIKDADLVIVAAGHPELIKGEWIKLGATVIDVGINRLADGRILGDVEFEIARHRAAFITPVPGGVGPMTIAMLLQNTVKAMTLQNAQYTQN